LVSAGKKATRVAILGADTLLGREVEEALGSAQVTSFSGNGEGTFAEEEGEAVFVQPLDAGSLREHEYVVLAGLPQGAQKAYELAKAEKKKPVLIDCLGDLEGQPEARISSTFFGEERRQGWLQVPPQASAQALALTLTRLSGLASVRQSVAHIFEPASERGRGGISELQKQTTSLLSFKALEKTIYDSQVAFNLLPRLGEDARVKLFSVEQRIERHLATLLSRRTGSAIAMPSVRLVQAPVFHGYSISLWAEFERNVSDAEVAESLASAQIEVRAASEEPPDAVGVAGQSGLIAGDVRVDGNNGRAVWVWLVADNLRLIADSVAAIVQGGNR
jgi:aspartate-semialdehyde dehydrogenase